jgi:hypothetical protein
MDERFVSLLPQQELKNIIIGNNSYKIYVASTKSYAKSSKGMS